mmetsp:Transcript_10642/g.44184  ORF Transcript_10642/g.44184 Transcript_10642/m.44184 type:complete len:215 (-) Transcript_10642:157-801(-)
MVGAGLGAGCRIGSGVLSYILGSAPVALAATAAPPPPPKSRGCRRVSRSLSRSFFSFFSFFRRPSRSFLRTSTTFVGSTRFFPSGDSITRDGETNDGDDGDGDGDTRPDPFADPSRGDAGTESAGDRVSTVAFPSKSFTPRAPSSTSIADGFVFAASGDCAGVTLGESAVPFRAFRNIRRNAALMIPSCRRLSSPSSAYASSSKDSRYGSSSYG